MTAKDSRPTFEDQLSELLLLLTPDQLQAARDLLRLLTGDAGMDCLIAIGTDRRMEVSE